jgi:hypothetical protein
VAVLRSPRHHLQKKPHTPASKITLTCSRSALHGGPFSLRSISIGWCSLTKPEPRPKRRGYGRSLRGKRCVAPILHGHWQTTTFVGALRATGMTAPMVLDGAMDGAAFEAYVKEVPHRRFGPARSS